MRRKRMAVLFLFFLSSLFLSACWDKQELKNLAIVNSVGVDLAEDGEGVLLTVEVLHSQGTPEEGAASLQGMIFSASGKSVSEAIGNLAYVSSKHLFWPYNDVIVFGRALAEDDLSRYLDYFIRSSEMRPGSYILLAEDRAEDIFNGKASIDSILGSGVGDMVDMQDEFGNLYAKSRTLHDVSSALLSPAGTVLIPVLSLSEQTGPATPESSAGSSQSGGSGEGGGKEEIPLIDLRKGMAVLDQDGYVSFLEDDAVRGTLLLRGEKTEGRILTLPGPEGSGIVSLELKRLRVRPHVEETESGLCVRYEISFITDLREQNGKLRLDEETADFIRQAQNDAIESECRAALAAATDLDADILDLGILISRQAPKAWAGLQDRWPERMQELRIDLDVKSELVFSGPGDILREREE